MNNLLLLNADMVSSTLLRIYDQIYVILFFYINKNFLMGESFYQLFLGIVSSMYEKQRNIEGCFCPAIARHKAGVYC